MCVLSRGSNYVSLVVLTVNRGSQFKILTSYIAFIPSVHWWKYGFNRAQAQQTLFIQIPVLFVHIYLIPVFWKNAANCR